MPFPSRFPLLSTALMTIVLLAAAITPAPVGATTALSTTALSAGSPLGTAAESPIAVPFLGDYEVWCTDRNPAPGNRCSSHHGSPAIDLGMDPGTPLHAAGSGEVIDADNHCPARGACNNGKGNSVIIAHPDGTFSRYLHMAQVSVATDDAVTVGQPIGTSGESGQYSSPHLHYDEHFPFGTRTDMGKWIGCVGGEQVIYPDVFGTTDWNLVPYGSRVVNDSWACLDGVDISVNDVPAPRILPGTTHYAVTPPSEIARSTYQISIDHNDGSTPEVVSLSGTTIVYRTAPANSISVRVRQLVNGAWELWSDSLDYTPGTSSSLPICAGLYATTASMTGTPDVDVIVGTNAADTINARGGDDMICGNDGDDTILAGIGQDRVFGGAGDDTIGAGKGADIVRGEAGDDQINGGEGPDKVFGGVGNDEVHGNVGNDFVDGGGDDDLVTGGIGHDWLRGAAGNDTVHGRNGRDVLFGGNGNDDISGDNGHDRLVGGAGVDTLLGGPGSDRCVATDTDTTRECER